LQRKLQLPRSRLLLALFLLLFLPLFLLLLPRSKWPLPGARCLRRSRRLSKWPAR
jgi:hypothetical protein